MSRLTNETDLLDDSPVRRLGHVGGKRVSFGVKHHRQVHVFEVSKANKLSFTGEELELVAYLTLHAFIDVYHLFCRNRKEHQ